MTEDSETCSNNSIVQFKYANKTGSYLQQKINIYHRNKGDAVLCKFLLCIIIKIRFVYLKRDI